MTNELKTRRLIVTLDDTAAEEVDELADILATSFAVATKLDRNFTVTHALGETLPDGVAARIHPASDRLIVSHIVTGCAIPLNTADDARQLAGALLRLADEAEARA